MNQRRLKELFTYDDGDLIRIVDKQYNAEKGDVAGCLFSGYLHINIDGRRYKAHRLVFLYHKGYMPEFIDHEDRNKLNNRINNLRECTKSENAYNQGVCSKNTSGYKNVSLHDSGLWRVNIQKNKKSHLIGYFKTPEEANIEAVKARERLHGKFANHGIADERADLKMQNSLT